MVMPKESALTIAYDPHPGQKAFHSSDSRYKAMVGAFGSGKTATGCIEGILLSLEYPGNVGLVARKSLPELKMTTMKRFFEFLPEPFVLKYNKTDRELYIRSKTGAASLVHFGPLDEINRYKSLELGWFFIDEADETSEDMYKTLIGRLRLKGVPHYGLLALNPTSTNHWIYNRWVKNPAPGHELFRGKTDENSANLPEGYVDELRANYPEDWQKRYLDGEFGVIQAGDRVYPDFSQEIHAKPLRHVAGRKIVRGWDFGIKRPAVVFAELPEAGGIRILHNILGDNEDLYQFSERVIRYGDTMWPGERFVDYCDRSGNDRRGGSGAKTDVQILGDKRIYPISSYSKPEERAAYIRTLMRKRLPGGEEAFLIDPTNQYLIEGFLGGYCLDEAGKPKKEGYFEHGQDALGYIVANTLMMSSDTHRDSDYEIAEGKWFYHSGGSKRKSEMNEY